MEENKLEGMIERLLNSGEVENISLGATLLDTLPSVEVVKLWKKMVNNTCAEANSRYIFDGTNKIIKLRNSRYFETPRLFIGKDWVLYAVYQDIYLLNHTLDHSLSKHVRPENVFYLPSRNL